MKTKRERFEERQQALRELHGHNWRNVCHLDMGGDSPPPPDYTPVANASKEAAEISAQLGREQLDESRRQYEQNIEIARPIVDAQKRNMDQAYEQGAANYESFKAAFGREQSVAQAVASSFGVKLGSYPADVLRRNLNAKAQAEIAEVEKNIAQLKRQRQTNRISQDEFQEAVQVEVQKKTKIMRDLAEKVK